MSSIASNKPVIEKALVQQSFDEASLGYNQYTALQRTIGNRLIAGQGNVEAKAIKVLDIGVGTGYLSQKISAMSGMDELHALDISLGMLKQTERNMLGVKPIELICADAEKLPFASSMYGAVYSNLAFQWCENLQQAFHEAHRVIQASGQFIFSTFGPKTLFELKESWHSADTAVHVNTFVDVEMIGRYLVTSGFRHVSVSSEDIVMYYESPKQLMLDLKGMGAHNINKGRQQGLTGVQAFKAMLNKYEMLRTDKGIPATFQAVYCYASK